jgi:hypothetical protein
MGMCVADPTEGVSHTRLFRPETYDLPESYQCAISQKPIYTLEEGISYLDFT